MARVRDPKTGRFAKVAPAVVASASVIPTRDLDKMPRMNQRWQERAWWLWQMLGVLHYPTSYMAEQVMRLDWDVEIGGNPLEPEQAQQAMEAVSIGIGVDEAARRISLNLEVAGEVYYIRKADEWQVVASTVPKRREKLEGSDIIVRGIQSDPVDPEQPDSPVRAALDVAEEIRVIQAQSRSQSRSRASTRGVLLIPKEVQFPEGDDFKGNLQDALVAPSEDEYHASNFSPLMVDVPGDTIEKWKLLRLDTAYDEKLQDRLDNAIRRLALSLNIPPEVLLGNIDSNHWNAWLSEESTYRGHLEPLALLTGQVFAEAMMEATGTEDIVVLPDPSELLARRSSVADSFKAFELGIVGAEYVRRAMGADEEDAPTPEEVEALKPDPVVVPAQGTGQAPVGAPPMPGNGIAAAVPTDEESLDALAEALTDIEEEMLSRFLGAADLLTDQLRAKTEDDHNAQQNAEAAAEDFGRVTGRIISQGRAALRGLGIEAKGPEWQQAQDAAVERATDGMRDWLLEVLPKTNSEMPALPTDLMRQVLALAGGSGTAVVAAFSAPRGILPKPETFDPQSFATGVLTTKQLHAEGIRLTQFRWRYGDAFRSQPFLQHKAQDGRFTSPGGTVGGWYVGDHKGCKCEYVPVYRRTATPQEV